MQDLSLKKVRLPNGFMVEVPETATQEQTMAYAKAKGYMSEEEMMIYDEAKDMLDVAAFYGRVDAVPSSSPIDDIFTKPLTKFAYAGYKEPKTLARALPDVGSVVGTAGAGVVAASAGLATVPTALVLGIGSALGYFGGKQAEEAITGVEQSTASQAGEAVEAGAVETGMALLPSVARRTALGVRALKTKELPLSSEFETEAQREFASEVAKKLQDNEAGLLTTQVGTPTGTHRVLASIARASAEGRGKIESVLQGQAEYLDKSITAVKQMYGDRLPDAELGDMYVELVNKQRELSNEAFNGLFKDRLAGTEKTTVSSAPVVNFAKAQINSIKKSAGYVDELADFTSKIDELQSQARAIRQQIIDAQRGYEGEELTLSLKPLRLDLDQVKLDIDNTKAEMKAFTDSQGIGMESAEVLSLYQDALKLQNKPNVTVEELNDFTVNLRSKISSLKSDNPAVANVVGFKSLVDMQELAERAIKSNLTEQQIKDYDAVSKLYSENSDTIRGNVVASLLRKEETPTSIANLITSSNNIDYFSSIDDITATTRKTLSKAGTDPVVIKQFEESAEAIKNGVRRKYLEKHLRQYMSEDKDAFASIGNFVEFINKEASEDVYKGLLGSGKGAEAIDRLLKEYRFLIKNLPRDSGGRFSLAVLSQQSIGSREAVQGAARMAAGDPTGASPFVVGLAKVITPEALSWYITNPKEAMRLTKITQVARRQAEQGKISIQVFSALSNAYNDMLNSLEEEQNSEKIYRDVMNNMQQLQQ
jgi:hypothetical protein